MVGNACPQGLVCEIGSHASAQVKQMARHGQYHMEFTGIHTTKMAMFRSGCSRNGHCMCQLVIGACVFVLRHWDILSLEIYRTHLLLNTKAETTHYIQDALVAKVYTSAKAVLAHASTCQVSGHASTCRCLWHGKSMPSRGWCSSLSGHATSNDIVPSMEMQQGMQICHGSRHTPLPQNVYTLMLLIIVWSV